MEREEILRRLQASIVNFDADAVKAAVQDALTARIPAYETVTEGLMKGMDIVGRKYEEREYFLTELILAGEAMQGGLEILRPHLKAEKVRATGKVVIGTVKGDMHNLGKNMVIAFLASAGFDIYDLGVDVSAERFVEKTLEVNADIVGMSALISSSFGEIGKTVEKLNKANLRNKVKVIIGGATVTESLARDSKVDACATDAVKGAEICKRWMDSGE